MLSDAEVSKQVKSEIQPRADTLSPRLLSSDRKASSLLPTSPPPKKKRVVAPAVALLAHISFKTTPSIMMFLPLSSALS